MLTQLKDNGLTYFVIEAKEEGLFSKLTQGVTEFCDSRRFDPANPYDVYEFIVNNIDDLLNEEELELLAECPERAHIVFDACQSTNYNASARLGIDKNGTGNNVLGQVLMTMQSQLELKHLATSVNKGKENLRNGKDFMEYTSEKAKVYNSLFTLMLPEKTDSYKPTSTAIKLYSREDFFREYKSFNGSQLQALEERQAFNQQHPDYNKDRVIPFTQLKAVSEGQQPASIASSHAQPEIKSSGFRR